MNSALNAFGALVNGAGQSIVAPTAAIVKGANAESIAHPDNLSLIGGVLDKFTGNATYARDIDMFERQLKESNRAYQRAAEDMKAAGINPALMYGSGGSAMTPGTNGGGHAAGAMTGLNDALKLFITAMSLGSSLGQAAASNATKLAVAKINSDAIANSSITNASTKLAVADKYAGSAMDRALAFNKAKLDVANIAAAARIGGVKLANNSREAIAQLDRDIRVDIANAKNRLEVEKIFSAEKRHANSKSYKRYYDNLKRSPYE